MRLVREDLDDEEAETWEEAVGETDSTWDSGFAPDAPELEASTQPQTSAYVDEVIAHSNGILDVHHMLPSQLCESFFAPPKTFVDTSKEELVQMLRNTEASLAFLDVSGRYSSPPATSHRSL